MANGIYNAFRPMNQAMQGLNQALVKSGQIKRQRRQNRLQDLATAMQIRESQANIADTMQDVKQRRGLQNYMQQRQGQIAQAQESTETRNLFRALARGEQPGSFQNMMAPRGGVEQPPEYNPIRAQYEYWKQIDPQQAGEIAEDILGQAKEIHEMGDPQAAAQFVEENLGIESRFAGGNQYDLKIQDGNLVRVDASGQQPPLIWRDGQWEPLEGRIPTSEQDEMSAKEKEIQRYLDLGIVQNKQEATKLAEGLYTLMRGPFGVELWDVAKGQMVRRSSADPTSEQQAQQAEQDTEQREPFIGVEEAKEGAGPISAAKQIINNVIGPFVPGQMYPDTEKARNKLRMFRQRIKPYLMVSSRGAVYEQQNIEKFLPNPDEVFTDPDATKDQLQNLYSMIQATIEKKKDLIESGQIDQDQLVTFRQDINKLQTALSYLPDENVLFSGQNPQSMDVKQLNEQSIQNMSATEIKQLYNSGQLDNLSSQQRQALETRVDQLMGQ